MVQQWTGAAVDRCSSGQAGSRQAGRPVRPLTAMALSSLSALICSDTSSLSLIFSSSITPSKLCFRSARFWVTSASMPYRATRLKCRWEQGRTSVALMCRHARTAAAQHQEQLLEAGAHTAHAKPAQLVPHL